MTEETRYQWARRFALAAKQQAGTKIAPEAVYDMALHALGMRAYLIDREGRFPERADALPTLLALPALLGLADAQ